MKNNFFIFGFLLLAGACTKKCPAPLAIFDESTSIKDSAQISSLIIGTWDWVGRTGSNYYTNPCYQGGEMIYMFDTSNNYKYFNNGFLLQQGHYFIRGGSQTQLYDSTTLNAYVSFYSGYLVLLHDTFVTDIYARRN